MCLRLCALECSIYWEVLATCVQALPDSCFYSIAVYIIAPYLVSWFDEIDDSCCNLVYLMRATSIFSDMVDFF